MSTATEKSQKSQSKPEPKIEQVKDERVVYIEGLISEPASLKTAMEKVENLKSRAIELKTTIEGRIRNFEVNLAEIKKKRDGRIVELRNRYDRCIDRGDASGADDCLNEIKAARQELENVCHNVRDVDHDIKDLQAESGKLHYEAEKFYRVTLGNFKAAEGIMKLASEVLGWAGNAINRDLLKAETIIGENKKLAEQILSE